MKQMKWISFVISALLVSLTGEAQEYLIKLNPAQNSLNKTASVVNFSEINPESIGFNNWYKIEVSDEAPISAELIESLTEQGILQANFTYAYTLHRGGGMNLSDNQISLLLKTQNLDDLFQVPPDNPEFVTSFERKTGADPLLDKQWGMKDVGTGLNYKKSKSEIIVAVIDTGVDYTHPDLVENMWINKKEIAGNGVDDDGNGYVDDIHGWDFVSDDNKPYDFRTTVLQLILGGGNPGHGTHCAGNVAARGGNAIGITGVASHAKIMALRFLGEKGQGTTEGAVKSIRYAVDNGARVLSNSWGSIGRGQNGEDAALKEAIEYARSKGVLFIAAAGNGDPQTGKGYDNDNNPKAAYPSSYDYDNIISVAAIDVENNLGTFSNWGKASVDIGAPGVNVFSTVVTSGANKYNNVVADLSALGMGVITWDGTSMATPHVAGAAALYWSHYPNKTYEQVLKAILSSSTKETALTGKLVTDGKLNVKSLMRKFEERN